MDGDLRIRLILSPRTPSVLAQRAQIRNFHHNVRMRARKKRRRADIRIQQRQPKTPPTAGTVAIVASERHLVQGCSWIVCGFPGAPARGNVVLCDMEDNVNLLGWGR